MAHALKLGKTLIRALDHGMRIGGPVFENQHGAGFGVAVAFERDHDAVLHLRFPAQRRFQVFRVKVHPLRGDDDVLLAALEVKIPLLVPLSDVARLKPSFPAR